MKEEWKEIPGYEGYYSVSDKGRIKSLKRFINHSAYGKQPIKERILSPAIHKKDGYSRVGLNKNGVTKYVTAHSMVLLAFVGERPCGQESMHLERVHINNDNSLHNLRYGSPLCNSAFKEDDGTSNTGSKNPMSKLKESDVIKIKKILAKNMYTNGAIGKKFNVSRQTISGISNNRRWTNV